MHKSLQEYLVAEKMFDEMLQLIEKNRKEKYFITDYKEVLKMVWELFSSHQISREIQTYLVDIIENYEDREEKLELADRLASFLPELFEKDFLYVFNLSNDINPMKKSLNVFYGYWTVLSSLGSDKNYVYDFFEDKLYFYLISRNHVIKNIWKDKSSEGNVPLLNLSYQVIEKVFFKGTNLRKINFYNSNLQGSCFLVIKYLVRYKLI